MCNNNDGLTWKQYSKNEFKKRVNKWIYGDMTDVEIRKIINRICTIYSIDGVDDNMTIEEAIEHVYNQFDKL